MYEQMTIAAANLYVSYNKSLDQFDRDHYAWCQAYAHRVRVEIPMNRYREAIEWLTDQFGAEDAHSFSDHIFNSRWCRFHPTTDTLVMEEGTFVGSLFGFKRASDAVLFKLRWMH